MMRKGERSMGRGYNYAHLCAQVGGDTPEMMVGHLRRGISSLCKHFCNLPPMSPDFKFLDFEGPLWV